jgi:hypothetical protein
MSRRPRNAFDKSNLWAAADCILAMFMFYIVLLFLNVIELSRMREANTLSQLHVIISLFVHIVLLEIIVLCDQHLELLTAQFNSKNKRVK